MDHLIRDKFENFSPAPPQHIWAGVQAGIVSQPTPGFFAANGRKITVAALILLLVSLGLWMILPSDGSSPDIQDVERISENNNAQNSGIVADSPDVNDDKESTTQTTGIDSDQTEDGDESDLQSPGEVEVQPSATADESSELKEVSEEDIAIIMAVIDESTKTDADSETNYTNASLAINDLNSLDGELENETDASLIEQQSTEVPPQINIPKDKPKINRWSHGIYVSPEIVFNDFDSVRILPSYALSYEPTYRFNKHWFMRFGLGLNYARERGFAKLDYISNEVIGTYEDVYDVTFDSIGGNLIPTYHTKTTEVWDSIRHVQVNEVTNKYLYLQTPLLFGYYNQSKKFNWYFYGGPALNVMVSKWIEKPEDEINDADIINLENNLPNRSAYYMQLWLGAGIEYKVGKQVSLALEPNYRYSFSHIYDDPRINTSLSGFSLRFGVVFTIK